MEAQKDEGQIDPQPQKEKSNHRTWKLKYTLFQPNHTKWDSARRAFSDQEKVNNEAKKAIMLLSEVKQTRIQE